MQRMLRLASLTGGYSGGTLRKHTRRAPWVRLQSVAAAVIQPRNPCEGGDRLSWSKFLDDGSSGISQVVVHGTERRVKVSWIDGHESEFTSKWLRDHCTSAFDPHTKQRELDTNAIPNDIRVQHASVEALSITPPPADATFGPSGVRDDQLLRLRWVAKANQQGYEESTIPASWLRQHCTSPTARDLRRRSGSAVDGANHSSAPVLWGAEVFSPSANSDPPCMEYEDIAEENSQQSPPSSTPPKGAVSRLLGFVRSHGIALVRGVPATEAGTEALALKLGGHLRSTLYGPGMWATSADTAAGEEGFRDSAYTNIALPLHTDCAYFTDPPGLQVFNCAIQATEGGVSTYADGFAVAERLRVENPEAFDFFSRTSIPYQCFDEGCHYAAEGPIFRLGPLGQVTQMRHNDGDRAPLDNLSNDDIDRFYEHHKSLSAIIRDPSMIARILLKPGDTVIVNNQRAMHGRESFKGQRRMVGCYVGIDEFNSMVRVHRV